MNDKNDKYILIAFICGCVLFFTGCIWNGYGGKFGNNISFVINSAIELILVALIFVGIPRKILARRLFHRIFLWRFNALKSKHNSNVTVVNLDYDSINLLTYWADVILIIFALRLLQLAEHYDLIMITIVTSLIWFAALLCYWLYIVNRIIDYGYRSKPSDNSQLHTAIEGSFTNLSGRLLLYDCLFWTGFTFLPGPPSGGIVISLFMFTAVSLIEEYTSKDDPFTALWRDKKKSVSLICCGSICFWFQWGEHIKTPWLISWVHQNIWMYNHSTPPLNGLFYPLLTYSSIIIIAIWRAGERHWVQQELARNRADEKQHLLSLLQSAFHNLKKDSDSLITYCNDELKSSLSPSTYSRVENMAMSVIGMYVVVNNIKYEMTIAPVSECINSDFSIDMLDKLLLNIVNNVEHAKSLRNEIKNNTHNRDLKFSLLNAPDKNLTEVVDQLNLISDEKRTSIINWETDTAKYWKIQSPSDIKIRDLIPDRSGIGLLRSLISELIRNSLKRTPFESPFFRITVIEENGYLKFIFMNNCKDPNDWLSIQKRQSDATEFKSGGGSQALYYSEQALKLKLQYEALGDYVVKVTLGVKIA